ncbi:MAG: glycosyltransferase [Synergistaceae bacterium]|nr:glycosyltransferase [Synergistaceae bacterium]
MKIVMLALASIFTESLTYQDNLLADQIQNDGNEVIIIADCFKYQNGKIIETEEEDKILNNGIHLIRKKYINLFGKFVSGKIRAVKGLYCIIENLKPDIIFHHGLQTYEMFTIIKYKTLHPEIKFYVDSHESFNNSATNLLSKYILHKIFYKKIIESSLPYIDKIFCVGYECFAFLKEMYDVPDDMMEFFPLGGNIFKDIIRIEKRSKIRASLSLRDSDLLLVHSGKMDKKKRTTDIVEAFLDTKAYNLVLVIIGSMTEDVEHKLIPLIEKNPNLHYLGWKKSEELIDYLCASDLYVQPGGQSATMQNALCCGSAAALYPHESHKYLLGDSVFYIETVEDMKKLFELISKDPQKLEDKRIMSFKIAQEKLDYKKLAARLYE